MRLRTTVVNGLGYQSLILSLVIISTVDLRVSDEGEVGGGAEG